MALVAELCSCGLNLGFKDMMSTSFCTGVA